MVINPVSRIAGVLRSQVVPGRRLHVLAPVLFPFDVGFVAQDACAFLADIWHGEEGADVEAHAVVEVRVPADGLFFQRLPAHVNVVGRFAFEDQLQLFLKRLCGGKAFVGSVHAASNILLLAADPIAQVSIDEGLQQFGVELVVVDQGGESVAQAIPDVPDEGAVLEQLYPSN
jgi:hypothetical protein